MDRTVLEAVAQFGRSQLTSRHHCFIGLLHLCTRLLANKVVRWLECFGEALANPIFQPIKSHQNLERCCVFCNDEYEWGENVVVLNRSCTILGLVKDVVVDGCWDISF